MKSQRFGIEIELTGITRAAASKAVAAFFKSKAQHAGGSYDEYHIKDFNERIWKVVQDGSIEPQKKVKGEIVSASDIYKVEIVSPVLNYEDIQTLQELVRKLRKTGAFANKSCGIHIHVDGANHTPVSLKNLINLIASKEDLIYKSLDIETSRIRYCKKVNENLLNTINKKKPETLEELAGVWYEGYSRESRRKHYHPTRYYGLNLHSIFDKGTVEFRLFNGTTHAGKIKAYIQFCLAVSHQAITQRSASAKRTKTDNEKYTFRCWMLRLGLIGEEFETCRYHFLANLEGNSAWRHAA
ncbi:virulence associated protein [Fervidicella metallireducens AeB]|uniref:Virulence associated protein n=1 Tax=Fervidicella metallireducens AeB TaxID=1403537 RepID=A0A017RUE5_9CLOT|nr:MULTISPECIES: amidoligase family protein [Clostridiaceae]EYE88024.1 virulence associated protein [Fervidicella metallireducens AeB]